MIRFIKYFSFIFIFGLIAIDFIFYLNGPLISLPKIIAMVYLLILILGLAVSVYYGENVKPKK